MIADAEIDVTAELCPMTYVRVRLALDRLPAGHTLAVTLRGAEARRSVTQSALRQGHELVMETGDLVGVGCVLLRRK